MSSRESTKIRLLAVMEARTVTGAAKNMLDFCRAARELHAENPGEAEIETSIATFERGRAREPNEFVEAARGLGIEVDLIAESRRLDPRVIPRLRQTILRRAPDLVLTHHVKSHFAMRCTRLRQRFPWVAFHHGYTLTERRERLYNRMDRLSLPAADAVVTVCEAFARQLTSFAGVARERIHVLHNSIRQDETATAAEARAFREKLGVGDGERLVLAIGRLSSEKAHIDLLRAFGHLRDASPELPARLAIVGDGPERERLKAAALSLGVSGRVFFTGQMSDVKPCYAAADRGRDDRQFRRHRFEQHVGRTLAV
jgi:glycosyltransferase involved in cell wall biosynthesis